MRLRYRVHQAAREHNTFTASHVRVWVRLLVSHVILFDEIRESQAFFS